MQILSCSHCLLLPADPSLGQFLFLCLPPLGVPSIEQILSGGCSFLFCCFNCAMLLCAVKLWEVLKPEGGIMWNLHPSELMVLISGRQIQFCTVSDRLKRHSCIYCNQPEFLPGLHYLVFYFLLPFISHFSPWFYRELSKCYCVF